LEGKGGERERLGRGWVRFVVFTLPIFDFTYLFSSILLIQSKLETISSTYVVER
jgi:hypothetical protein